MTLSSYFRRIIAGGDVVGRDKVTHNHFPAPRQLDLLSEAYKKEVETGSEISYIIEELQHYRTNNAEIRDLTEKLSDAGFSCLIEEAEVLKELIAKLIIKYQNYKSAQKIIVYLLSEIESIFNSRVKPKLISVSSESEVKCILRDHIQGEVQDKLGENVLEIFNRQIDGMVYFLTGNCHVEWS
jgi:hypothetical protein